MKTTFHKQHPGSVRAPASAKSRRRTRWTAVLLTTLLLTGCFTGCGSDGATDPTPDQRASLPAATVPDAAPETKAASTRDSTAVPTAPETAAEVPVTEPDTPETEAPQPLPDGTLGSEEAVADLLARNKASGAREIEFTCSDSLFEALQARRFDLLQILLLKAGIQAEIRYRASDRLIALSDVTGVDTNWAECATELAVRQAFLQFAAEQAESFSLICPPDLIDSLRSGSKLFNFAAQAGWMDVNWQTSGSILEASDLVPFDEPYAVAADAAQFAAAVEGFAARELTSFYIVREQKYREQLQEDSLAEEIMVAGSMLETYGGTSTSSGIYHYTDVSYTTDPKLFCYSEEDVVSAIRQMGAIGTSAFRLYLVGSELVDAVCADHFLRLHELEAEAGMSAPQMSFSFSQTLRELQYSEANIVADAVSLETAGEAVSYVEEKVRSGAGEITLFCSEALYADLIGELDNRFSFSHDGMTPIYDLLAHAGIYDYELTSSRASHAVTIRIKHLYPGAEILLGVQNGTEGELDPRLQQTLQEARAIAESCKTADPLETAEKIHDAICGRVTYETLEEKSDNDTAVGVLLNGKADCDGYSDAFYLIGGLAGLRVRYQHGNGVNTGFYGFGDSATHMWNLLELDGAWRMVDVTWDDSSDAVRHSWFNLGNDRASRSHRWNPEMTVSLLEKTDLSTRPENEFSVTSADELEAAVAAAAGGQAPFFAIIFDNEDYQDRQAALELVQRQLQTAFTYSWNEEMRMLSVYPG